MKKVIGIFIQGWIVFAKYFYFAVIFSIFLTPVGLIPLIVSLCVKLKEPYLAIIYLASSVFVTPFACYFTYKITKLLGPQVSFPIICPKCGSFIERKNVKSE